MPIKVDQRLMKVYEDCPKVHFSWSLYYSENINEEKTQWCQATFNAIQDKRWQMYQKILNLVCVRKWLSKTESEYWTKTNLWKILRAYRSLNINVKSTKLYWCSIYFFNFNSQKEILMKEKLAAFLQSKCQYVKSTLKW